MLPLRALAVLITVLALAATPRSAGAIVGRPDSPYGSHSMVYVDASSDFKRAMFREAAESGASTIRLDIALSGIWAGGAPDWRGVDEFVALSREFGLRISAVLLAQPYFVARCPDPADEPRNYLCPPGGDAGFFLYGQMLEQLARRTRGVVELFEIVNEPDGAWAFKGTAADYARMLSVGHDAIKRGAPGAKVLLGGVMGLDSRPFLEAVFATPGFDAADKFDIANVHVRGPLGSLPGTIRAWREFFARHGAGDRPLWVTEFGYPAEPAFQYDPAFRGGEASQAAYLRAGLPALVGAGAAKVFVSLRDLDWPGPFASEGIVAGAVDHTTTPAPRRRAAFAALAAVADPAKVAEEARAAAEAVRAAEAARVAAEQARAVAEQERVAAEQARAAAERTRFLEDVRAALARARHLQDVRAALERAAYVEAVRAALQRARYEQDVRAALVRARYEQDVLAALERARVAEAVSRAVARTRRAVRRICPDGSRRACARARSDHAAARAFAEHLASAARRH